MEITYCCKDCGNKINLQTALYGSGICHPCAIKNNKNKQRTLQINPLDILNKKFNNLTIIEYLGKKYLKSSFTFNHIYKCRCNCGKYYIGIRSALISGHTKSCGCLKALIKYKIRKKFGESSFKSRYYTYIAGAKKRGYAFELSFEDFLNLSKQQCHYCGTEPKNKFHATKSYGYCTYNGVDRVNNKKGYIKGNVVPCCFTCNYAKKTLSATKFKNWIKRAYKHLYEKN
jgi:hypothetical protein